MRYSAEGRVSQNNNKTNKANHPTKPKPPKIAILPKPNQTKQAEGGQFPYTWKTFLWAPGMRRYNHLSLSWPRTSESILGHKRMSLENGELAGLSTRARSEQTSKGRDGSSNETAGRTHVWRGPKPRDGSANFTLLRWEQAPPVLVARAFCLQQQALGADSAPGLFSTIHLTATLLPLIPRDSRL